METISFKLTGIRPLIMHNGRLADPLDPFSKALKEVSGKRIKTEADYRAMAKIEFEGSLYVSDDFGPCIPSDNIERVIQLGAQKRKLGKAVVAALFCTDAEYKLEYKGPRNVEELYANAAFHIRKGVGVNGSKVMRTRPMFPTGWSIKIDLEYDEGLLNKSDIIAAVTDAGKYVGIGDWRPKFGRFVAEVII